MPRETSSCWISEFHNQLLRGRHLILTDNIADQFLVNGQYQALPAYLEGYFQNEGYEVVGCYDILDGLHFAASEMQAVFTRVSVPPSAGNGGATAIANAAPGEADRRAPGSSPPAPATRASGSTGPGQARVGGTGTPASCPAPGARMPMRPAPEEVLPRIRQALRQAETPVAMIIDFADKLFSDPERQADTERELVVLLKKCMEEAAFLRNGRLQGRKNVLILVAEQLGAIPAWLYQRNPFIAVLHLPRPRREERACFVSRYFDVFFGGESLSDEQRKRIVEIFADVTDGLTARDLETIRRISVAEQMSIQNVQKLVDYFKIGRMDDPWKELDVIKIREALPRLEARVLGQPHALKAAVDMLACARGGISTTRSSGRGGQPKGVLWFCGPTGVGKTELARALTALVFGDERAFVKLDMSEFRESHTRSRLIGAPPSYVGYDQGGELTGPCQQRPFSLFLFDEIEKAHTSLLDIFLQILDDGRLTDGKGQTAYFSKSCLVFTSNVGGSRWDVRGTAPEDLPTYEEVHEHYETAVRDYLTHEIGRPELLNRLGDNIVVFDILRPEFFPGICNIFLENLAASAREQHGIELDFSDGRVVAMICERMRDPKNFILGGRRIHELIKAHVRPPLNRAIAFQARPVGSRWVVSTDRNDSRILIDGNSVS
ncbi:MAG: AAA family ATPase [Planctomycetota bacterium]